MTKAEFIKHWSAIREQYLRKAYKGQPHGDACLIMSLCDIPQEAEKLWRKHRRLLKHSPVETWARQLADNLEDRKSI